MYRISIKRKLISIAMIAAVGIGGMYAVRNSYDTISHNVSAYTENTNKLSAIQPTKANDIKIKNNVIYTELLNIVQPTETSLNEDYDDAFEAIKKKFLNLQKKCDKLNGK